MALGPLELRILLLSPKESTLESLASSLRIHPDSLRRSIELLAQGKLIAVRKADGRQVLLSDEGVLAVQNGLPEMRLLSLLSSGPQPVSELDSSLRSFGLPMAKKAAWVSLENGQALLTEEGRSALASRAQYDLPSSSEALNKLEPLRLAEFSRRNLVRIKASSQFFVSITEAGMAAAKEPSAPAGEGPGSINVSEGSPSSPPLGSNEGARPSSSSMGEGAPPSLSIPPVQPIRAISREMLLSGQWKSRPLAPYDVSAPAPVALAARRHPISRLRNKIRSIFVQMGFEEMGGPLAESAFWNFDALFQPQDHPARDLADTFYLDGKSRLPDSELVEAVRGSHEKGWHYSWDGAVAQNCVLRTHTTAVSARTLYANKDNPAPRKFFSIGKVFRNEATDYKHLAEFYQVEGIVSWDGATFGHLLGTLKAFYARLGFEKIRFRPSYFPYTEPSLEIEVYHPARQAWLELGGAGILRPEVSEPLCGKYPVLAWGLSLERPLMLANKIEDIRTLYRNDLGWLRNFVVQ